ncbi:class II aldolase/adducin family protein [Sphingobium aquiterrae]|uniref:class II aldolase/adducin family protein n=1 Tax=Sphingobium aquiterrae TaxID=2038656 RepID=UPI003017E6CB
MISMQSTTADVEWETRVSLAALYRLVALYGWDDMIFTHISARVPGSTPAFLINPYGHFFEEMTASSLIKVDIEGAILDGGAGPVNRAGFVIHSAIHAARPDAHFIIHLHTDAGVAVSAQKEGLLPLTQHALIVLPKLAYHDFEGIALDTDERARIVADLGSKSLMLLRNHGTLALGSTPAEAIVGMQYLERACSQQVLALTAGRDGVLMAPRSAQEAVRRQTDGPTAPIWDNAWEGCLRMLDRKLPGYAQ